MKTELRDDEYTKRIKKMLGVCFSIDPGWTRKNGSKIVSDIVSATFEMRDKAKDEDWPVAGGG